MNPKFCILAGILACGTAVALGAFGAHALESRLPQWYADPAIAARLAAVWETGVRYQFLHGLALLVLGLWSDRGVHCKSRLSGYAFAIGILLFSGCLYALVLSGVRALGAIVPLGGISFLVGWGCWFRAVLMSNDRPS